MHTLTRLGTLTAAIMVAVSPAATLGIGAARADTTVGLQGDLRRCDFSLVTFSPLVAHPRLARGSALIHTEGSQVVAEVHLYDPPQPGTHFDVGLIQVPRPSSATCGPGDPGTAFTGMDIDGSGNGTATLRDTVRSGTTGVWVIIERANPNAQHPAEFYTSEFVAPV